MNQETSERQMDACNFRSRVREAVRRLGEIDPEPSQEVYYGQLLALMDRSMVFQLPDDGLSLGVMSGYDFSKLDLYGRLPFPVVALEFRMSGKLPVYRDAPVVTNRRFALALDLMTPEILSLVHTMFPGMIDEASGSLGGLVEHDGALDAFVLLPFDSMEGANADRLREVGFDFEQIWFPGWAGAVVPYRQTGSGSYLRSADIRGGTIGGPWRRHGPGGQGVSIQDTGGGGDQSG
ncbi:MAG: hypothetical protein E6R08_10295 [Nevskiaceae bacterium]|nr:MAG: hypothetical protein E6R08_10295 [Nevskiaceae bacterium]